MLGKQQLTKTAIEKKENTTAASPALLFCTAGKLLVLLQASTRKQKHTNHMNVHSAATQSATASATMLISNTRVLAHLSKSNSRTFKDHTKDI